MPPFPFQTQTVAPFFGARSTVEAIRASALAAQGDFQTRQLAEMICGDLRAKDYLSEYLAIYNFVHGFTRYMRDPRTVELVKQVKLIIDQLLRGERPNIDCDEQTALLLALILSVGGSGRLVTVAFSNVWHKGEQQFSHIFVQALEPRTKSWVTLDPVAAKATNKMLGSATVARIWNVA